MSDSMPVKEIVNNLESCAQWFEEHGRNTNTAVVPICRSAIYIINCQEEALENLAIELKAMRGEVKRLENDLEEMADRLGELLWYATDGKLSKSNYTKEVMISAVIDCIEDYCREAQAEATKKVAEVLEAELESANKYVHEYDDSAEQRAYAKGLHNAWSIVKEMEA